MVFSPKPRQDVAGSNSGSSGCGDYRGHSTALLSSMEAAENGAQVFLFPNGQELGDATFLFQEGLAAVLTPSGRVGDRTDT